MCTRSAIARLRAQANRWVARTDTSSPTRPPHALRNGVLSCCYCMLSLSSSTCLLSPPARESGKLSRAAGSVGGLMALHASSATFQTRSRYAWPVGVYWAIIQSTVLKTLITPASLRLLVHATSELLRMHLIAASILFPNFYYWNVPHSFCLSIGSLYLSVQSN